MSERLGSFSRSRSPSNGRISLGSMAEDKIMLEGGLRRLSSDEIVPPPPSAPDAEEPLAVHGLMERRSYEAPIAFAGERDFTPLNPRGRTGLSGRGCLNHWGPNHVCEPLITRFHPRGDSEGSNFYDQVAAAATANLRSSSAPAKPETSTAAAEQHPELQPLQVLAFREADESGLGWSYRIPSYFDVPGSHVSLIVQAELLNEVETLYKDDKETAERLTHLLSGIFTGDGAQEVYRGYLDDPRNTDNAWIEATAYHHHFSRELGGLLPFSRPDSRAKWVSITDRQLHVSSAKWLDTVSRFVEFEFSRPCLLQLVVRWGRNDIAQMVLSSSELKDQQQQTHVQRALQDALERAMESSFDAPSLVETLFENGAEAAGIFLPDLFKHMQNDSFGFCEELRRGKFEKKGRLSGSRRRSLLRAPLDLLRGGASGGGGQILSSHGTYSPWQDRHVQLMLSLPVLGFDDYARGRLVVQPLDLMCWAILVGSLEVAHLMWQRTRSPLRAGLIAEAMCEKIKLTRHMCKRELDEAIAKFSSQTVGVLDHLTDREEVRKLLTGKHGELKTLGCKGAHTQSTSSSSQSIWATALSSRTDIARTSSMSSGEGALRCAAPSNSARGARYSSSTTCRRGMSSTPSGTRRYRRTSGRFEIWSSCGACRWSSRRRKWPRSSGWCSPSARCAFSRSAVRPTVGTTSSWRTSHPISFRRCTKPSTTSSSTAPTPSTTSTGRS